VNEHRRRPGWIEKEQFEALLAGKSEEEVSGSEAPPPGQPPVPREPAMAAAASLAAHGTD
jgi:hypothetical protein